MTFLHERGAKHNMIVLRRFFITLCIMIAAYSVIFHWLMEYEGKEHSWITGVYWTLTVMSTLGFGDITFSSDPGRIFSIIVLMSGVIFFLIMMPFTFIQHFYMPWLESQKKDMVPRRLPAGIRGHVLIAGSGPITLNLADDLARHGIRRVLLCNDPQTGLDLLDQGYEVAAGDHDDVKTYQKLHADTAAMLVVMDTDIRSTNIVFSAREAAPQVVIAAGVENPDATDILRLAGCNRVFQFHNVLGEAMARRVVRSSQRASIMGRFGRLVVAEAPVMHSSLAGKTLLDCSLRERTGINVVGVWDRGAFQLPGPHTMFTESSVLVVAGTEKQVRTFDRLISEPEKAEMENVPVVILGGGRVGLAVARNLARRKIPAVIVDRQPHINSGAIPHVHGDAADLAVLEKAGIRKTRTIIITTHDDDANIYLTIYCRSLRPDVQIISRASLDRNVNGLHLAGADLVLSLASLVSATVINLLSPNRLLMLNERLSVFRSTVSENLAGMSLARSGIRGNTRCSVLAVHCPDGTSHINPEAGYVLARGDTIYLIGDNHAQTLYRKYYGIDTDVEAGELRKEPQWKSVV